MTGKNRANGGDGRALILTSLALALLLTTAPLPRVSVDGVVIGAMAWAGGGNGNGNGGNGNSGNGQGGGNGNGSDHGSGKSDSNGKSGDRSGRGHRSDASSVDGPGRGHGRLQEIEAALSDFFSPRGNGRGSAGVKAEARERYAALDGRTAAMGRAERSSESFGRRQVVLDADLADALVRSGWHGSGRSVPDGFRNHGDRVRTMVELAKTLGYGAHVGALQANFGAAPGTVEPTPPSADRAALAEELADARAELEALQTAGVDDTQAVQDRIAELEQELAALDAPTSAPEWDGDWRTADLDVNDDGRVDHADLDLARAGTAPVEAPDVPDDAPIEPGSAPELAEPAA
ncbi:MAG: hypothetical protein R3D25_02570 [Geminicoccaceae bacterium]